jgi:predicted transcriptional regulator
MAFSKKYIGKGKQVENMEIVEVSINLAELQNHSFEYEGETYVKFNVAKLKEPDQYRKTHTVYIFVKEPDSGES